MVPGRIFRAFRKNKFKWIRYKDRRHAIPANARESAKNRWKIITLVVHGIKGDHAGSEAAVVVNNILSWWPVISTVTNSAISGLLSLFR